MSPDRTFWILLKPVMFACMAPLGRLASGRLLTVCVLGWTHAAHAQVAPTDAGYLPPVRAPVDPARPQRGVVVVSVAAGAGVSLLVDGRPAGALPQRLELEPGMHEISGLGPDVDVYPVRVRVEAGKTVSIGLNVVPRAASFEIDPVAPDALLVVDQKPLGVGKRAVPLTPGYHELELRRAGYQTQRLSLKVFPGQRGKLRAAPYVASRADGMPATPSDSVGPAKPPTEASPRALSEATRQDTNATEREAAKGSPRAVDADASEISSPYTGLFGSFIVPVMLGGKSTHSYLTDCPATPYGGACTASAPRGGGLALRVGYFYEWLGLELVGAGAVDVTTTELKLPPIATISSAMQDAAGRSVFVRAGGMYGIGARLAVPMQGLRITVGADYLFIYRKVYAIPDSFAGTNLSYTTPGWLIDGGIQLGSTPGARFYLGAFVLIEQAHDLPLTRNLSALGIDPKMVPEELTHMTVYQGRQVFYGPLLGIAFGH